MSFAALVAWFVIYAVLRLTPVDDADVFTQIRLGFDGPALGSLSYMLTGSGYPNPGRLSQKVLAFVFSGLGWEGLQALKASMYASAVLIALSAAEPPGKRASPLAILGASLAAFLVMLSNATLRPQMFAALCFALSYRIAASRARIWPSALAMLVVGTLWQNLHPSTPTGVVTIGCLLVAELFGSPEGRAYRTIRLGVLGATLAACQVLTPLGASIFDVSAANLRVSVSLGVSEWMPAWHESVRGSMAPFFVSLVPTLAAVLAMGRRLPRGPLLASVALAAATLASARFALFFALAACPLWLAALDSALGERGGPLLLRPARALLIALVLGSSAGLLARYSTSPLADSRAPVAAVMALREKLPEGRVYNYREWAGPLHLLGRPGWQTGLDGRLYLFGAREWRDYVSEASGDVALDEIERRHSPDAFFLHPGFHADLIPLIRSSGRWMLIHEDDMAVVFVRKEGDADADSDRL